MKNIDTEKGRGLTSFEKMLIIFLIVLNMVAMGFVCRYCLINYSQQKRLKETAQELTKVLLAKSACEGEIYRVGYNMMKESLEKGMITAKGYVGNEMDPNEIMNYVENQKLALNEMLVHATNYYSESDLKDTCDNLDNQYIEYFVSAMKTLTINISKLTPIENLGSSPEWYFKERSPLL